MPSQAASQTGATHVRQIVAANLDRGIVAKGLTNRAVGEAIGTTEHQVWRWRAGKHTPNQARLVDLADLLFAGDLSEFYAEPKVAA